MATNRKEDKREGKNCRNRIQKHFDGRMADLKALYAYEPENITSDEMDKRNEARSEYGLGFDYVAPGTFKGQRRGYFRYQLSWGGPSDEFRFFCDENRKPVRIEYWFMDWFDGAKKVLGGADYDLLAAIFDDFDGCGMVEERMREALEN